MADPYVSLRVLQEEYDELILDQGLSEDEARARLLERYKDHPGFDPEDLEGLML